MSNYFFATDLHGRADRYEKLLSAMVRDRPRAVFLGGDLLPQGSFPNAHTDSSHVDFARDFLIPRFAKARIALGKDFPSIFMILGNDDPRCEEPAFLDAQAQGLWKYMHGRKVLFGGLHVYGLAYIPPTPFLLKDWERYDVSRYVPPACVSPEQGYRTVPVTENEIKWGNIEKDVNSLAGNDDLSRAVFLFHAPPHDTPLDRAALDGRTYDHVALDVHVGSIAVRRFIETRQPLLALHGHVHESARLSGGWSTQLGRTICLGGAHDGTELALVRFDPESPDKATRELL